LLGAGPDGSLGCFLDDAAGFAVVRFFAAFRIGISFGSAQPTGLYCRSPANAYKPTEWEPGAPKALPKRTLPVRIGDGTIACMGISRIRSIEPDLFATPADECSAPLARPPPPAINSAAPSARYVLPKNLAETIKRLEDRELERLLTVELVRISSSVLQSKRLGRQPRAKSPILPRPLLGSPVDLPRLPPCRGVAP
jgi:hypothetical protein